MCEKKKLEFQRYASSGRFDLNAYIIFLFQRAEVGAAWDERVEWEEISQD